MWLARQRQRRGSTAPGPLWRRLVVQRPTLPRALAGRWGSGWGGAGWWRAQVLRPAALARPEADRPGAHRQMSCVWPKTSVDQAITCILQCTSGWRLCGIYNCVCQMNARTHNACTLQRILSHSRLVKIVPSRGLIGTARRRPTGCGPPSAPLAGSRCTAACTPAAHRRSALTQSVATAALGCQALGGAGGSVRRAGAGARRGALCARTTTHHLDDLALVIRDDLEHEARQVGHAGLVDLVVAQQRVPARRAHQLLGAASRPLKHHETRMVLAHGVVCPSAVGAVRCAPRCVPGSPRGVALRRALTAH